MFSFKKTLTWFLIGILLFQQIFQVPFLLPRASALEIGDHEDVVSLLVEEELFSKISRDIDTYARRIQAKLPKTRTVILTYPRDAHPFLIASANERLYYSGIPGHGKKTQKLVGTILIGHVPLPVVHKDNESFLSLFPYTDFDEPHFFWNWESKRYEYLDTKRTDSRPDVWHSVIDPNTGNIDNDVTKIRDFFARVYQFDAKQGAYANLGKDPEVLYMDSISESKSSNKGLLSIYEQIFLPNQENFIYHRYTREFAQYIYENFLTLMQNQGTSTVLPFSQWKKSSGSVSSFLDSAGDITTKIFSDELITPFLKVVNEKYLGDVARWVHNTGRYYNGSSDVRFDTVPEIITQKDAITTQVLKETNDMLEKVIDQYVDTSMSLDIPLLVSRPGSKTISEIEYYQQGGKTRSRYVSRTYDFSYENYFYGTKASTITDARMCSLFRGSSFGSQNARAELNHGYNVGGAQADNTVLTVDTQAGIKCDPMTQSYWGGNSPLNVTYKNEQLVLGSHRYDDFSLPILDSKGGKRTTAGSNSPLDCLRTDLILVPYQHVGLSGKRYLWPVETSGTRYSCITPLQSPTPDPFYLDPTPELSENILTNLQSCSGTGNITLLARNGSTQTTCQAQSSTGVYKRISSLVKHADPSREIYGSQLQSTTAPNLPVDEERFLSYVNREGREVRINYPNIFDITVSPSDTDEMIIDKISTALTPVTTQLVPGKEIAPTHPWTALIQTSTTKPDLSTLLLSSPQIKTALIDALRWKSLDIETKYSHALDLAVSDRDNTSNLLAPGKKDIYEIAYLGGKGDARNFVFGFSPDENADLPEWFTDIQDIQNNYQNKASSDNPETDAGYTLSSSEIAGLLGESTSDDSSSSDESDDSSSSTDEEEGEGTFECGDPSGVVIWEWPAAIQCWLSNLMKTEWFSPDIGDFEFPELPSLTVSFGGDIVWSTKELKEVTSADTNNNNVADYVESNRSTLQLNNTFSDTVIEPNTSIRIDTSLEDVTNRINDDQSQVQISVTRIEDLDEGKTYNNTDANWSSIVNQYVTLSGSSTLRDGHAVWILQSKSSHRARITVEARIFSSNTVFVRSEKTVVLIGPTTTPITVVGSTGVTTSQTIIAGDTAGFNVLFTGSQSLPATANLDIYDYVTGVKKATFKSVSIQDKKIHLGSPTVDEFLRVAGKYKLVVSAGENVGETYFTVSPGDIHHVDIDAPSLLLRDQSQSLSITLRDSWNNTISADGWGITLESSDAIIASGFSSTANTLFTGKLTSPLAITPKQSGALELVFTFKKGDKNIVETLSRQVIADIKLVADISQRDTLEVGQTVPVNFSIQRQDGSVVENWDIPLHIAVQGGTMKLKDSTMIFVGGKSTTTLSTGTRPAVGNFSLADVNLGKIIGDSFIVHAGPPVRLTLDGPDTIHARVDARDQYKFSLYDAYGNLTSLRDYQFHIESDKSKLIKNITSPALVSEGIYESEIVSQGYPGRMLLRVWLEKNGKKSTISTLENALQINFLPVLTPSDMENNSWNTLTQVLLGGPFGQTPTSGYFAGSSLFSPETTSLSISTLIDSVQSPIFTVTPQGGITVGSLSYGTGIGVYVESFVNRTLSLLLSDSRLGKVAHITYPQFAENVSLVPCDFSKSGDCEKDAMFFVPGDSSITYQDGKISKDGSLLFNIKDIFSFGGLSFDFITNTDGTLQFSVRNGNEVLGTLHLLWKSRIATDERPTPDTYYVQPLISTILSRVSWTQTSSYEMPSLAFYDSQELAEGSEGAHTQGWSHYPDKTGLGWTSDNVSLLQFASGQEWSTSVRDHADYLTINIGDPIVTLPEYNVNAATGFDHTIGDPVYQGISDVSDFTFRDINNDGRRDLDVYHDSGIVGARVSRDGDQYADIGNLLSVQEAEDGMIRVGDFTGDGFADVVYVDTDGILHLVNHDAAGPQEKVIQYNTQPLLGQILQLEVFDMDHDGIDDIVLLDHLGSLYIFYGTTSGVFTVQLLEHVYDFVFSSQAQATYFTGAVRYDGPGFVTPDSITQKTNDFETVSKQTQINQSLFTQIQIARATSSAVTAQTSASLGSTMYDSLNNDSNGFLRGYDGDASQLASTLRTGYDSLQTSGSTTVSVIGGSSGQYDVFDVLRAPFVDKTKLLITKKYASLEASSQVVAGSPIEVTMEIKNNSPQNISNIIILEKFPDYLSVSDFSYTLISGDTKETHSFVADSAQQNAGIIDLRGKTLKPGQSIKIVYNGTLRSFSFGHFDVGYLEDKDDPTSADDIPKDKIFSINSTASQLDKIPEKDFYNHDNYGDIRFNPNETCGGPLLLWRSHNAYDRTYHKTVIVRDIQDPDKNATEVTQNPTSVLPNTSSGVNESQTTSTSSSSSSSSALETSQSDLATWQADGDGDTIPDSSDDDNGDVFEVSTSGNQTQISIGLGEAESAIDEINKGVKDILSGLSCGFGSAGCISMPINWAANMPGNTVTFMGFAFGNVPPIACYDDVRCGYPIFSTPTDCCRSSSYTDLLLCAALKVTGSSTNVCTWPSAYGGAGGAFDYESGAASGQKYVKGSGVGTFTGGEGISTFRIFIGATLTGAVAEVMCFGKNTKDNLSINVPGLFPITFVGNCIFATQPLFQCEDDGSEESPLVTEMDMSEDLGSDDGDDGDSGDNSGADGTNVFTNADDCGFYEPISSYPADLSQAVANYFTQTNTTTTDALQTAIGENSEFLTDSSGDSSLQLATLSPDDSYERLNNTRGLSFTGSSSGTGIIQISLDPSAMKFKNFGKVIDIQMRSIRTFPNFVMDWYHRQIDEIVASLSNLPDIKIVLPELSGLADSGWISSFGSGFGQQLKSIVSSPSSTTSGTSSSTTSSTGTSSSTTGTTTTGTSSTSTSGSTTSSGTTTTTSATGGSTSSTSSSSSTSTGSSGNILTSTGNTLKKGFNTVTNTLDSGLNFVSTGLGKGLGAVDSAKNTVTSAIQQKTTGIQNAFEYLGTLPIIDVHPKTISFNIPWVGKQEAQAWIARNEAILESWEKLPSTAVNSINTAPLISSIQSNIETVRTYLELPERLQTLFYLKEKLLYGIIQNVQAIQNLMGGWLYDNGLRFKAWVETFILVTRLWDLWQVLFDVFNDYEVSCGVCRNERWNLQHWLWIIISLIIPPIPVIQMPRWPDIELNFTDIDLSLDIAYPVFNLSFYPVQLPDAPTPTLSGFSLDPMPQLPQLPNLNIDFEIPVIQLPKLPDLPPPPKIPELSQAITVVLKIFKLIVLIMCLYRKVPLSPEWYVGTKVAHKTERQGYLPFDFLDVRMPTVTTEFIDTIRVATHIKLEYDVDFVTDMIESALEPFTNFPRDLQSLGVDTTSSVHIDINPDDGVQVQTSALDPVYELPRLLTELFHTLDNVVYVDPLEGQKYLSDMMQKIDVTPERRQKIQQIIAAQPSQDIDQKFSGVQEKFEKRFETMNDSLALDMKDNSQILADLQAWSNGSKKPEEIAFIGSRIPGSIHLASSTNTPLSRFMSLDQSVLAPARNFIGNFTQNTLSAAAVVTPPAVPAPSTVTTFANKALDTSSLQKTRGLYVTRGAITQKLIDYTEDLDGDTKIHAFDDDRDGDRDVYYSIGNTIYRKENHANKPQKYFIADAPIVYNLTDIYSDFFDIDVSLVESLFGDAQIDLLRTDKRDAVRYQYLLRDKDDHLRLFLFRSLFHSEKSDAAYVADIMPEFDILSLTSTTIVPQPIIHDIDGQASIEHSTVYRTLIPNQLYIDDVGDMRQLSSDFVIRANQSGYTSERTTMNVYYQGQEHEYNLRPGDRIVFADDAQVDVREGSLMLLSTTSEKRLLTLRDISLPLLPGDKIVTDKNGSVDISFPDGTQTTLTQNQHWMLDVYDPEIGISSSTLSVDPYWYYGHIENARTLSESRISRSTIFDAYSEFDPSAALSQIPTEISISFDQPTEIDFQNYFPADTLDNVEVLRLAESEWRRDSESPTKIIFQTQKERKEILLRITAHGIVRDYDTTLVTKTPKLVVDSLSSQGLLTGHLNETTLLPLGIQSYIAHKVWTLATGISLEGTVFSTSFVDKPKFEISYASSPLVTISRNDGSMIFSAGVTIVPELILGKPLSLNLRDSKGEKKLQLSYQTDAWKFSQITNTSDIHGNGIFFLGSSIRFEPPSLNDANLQGGAYLTDTDFRPLIAFDKTGTVRYIDTTVVWKVTTEGNLVIYTLVRDGKELGKMIVSGEMTTYWKTK